jgi:hypothetical protein
MESFKLIKKTLCHLLVISFILTSCMPSDVPSSQKSFNSGTGFGTTSGVGNGVGATQGGVGAGTSLPPKIEIRHLIEPNLSFDPTYSSGTGHGGGGSYVRKLTLPKNFQGRLYVAGINIGTLSNRHVRVRFRFGLNREPIIIPATVSTAPGITPSTGIHVLVLDMRSEPFRQVRLPYDLFDYNEYNFANGDTPVQDNRDTGLYCRGLRIEDDPTFVGVGACDSATGPSEECLYAYAKLLDQGLVARSGSVFVPLTPSMPQVKSTATTNYYTDWLSQQLLKPLPDTIPYTVNNLGQRIISSMIFSQPPPVQTTSTDSQDIRFEGATAWDTILINNVQHFYRGPYRLMDTGNWHFRIPLLDGKNRLFKENSWVNIPPAANDGMDRIYFNSYMFPLATKIDLQAGVAHLSSSSIQGVRGSNILPVAGKTLWMDGANARAMSRNFDLEHVGSCNVSSSIEIIAKDDSGNDFVLAVAKDVKLQLVRPTQHRTDTGNEVLYTNFKSCFSNSSCGNNECCFNNRCWDQTLVSQCFDDSSTQGNKLVGQNCITDLECTSLCCNRTSGLCAPHNSLLNPAVLCSKPVGDFCIAKEWCQKTPVVRCLIVRTGTDPLGNTTCRQHCYNTFEFGDCKNGICVPPPQDTIPTFDPNDPDVCDGAVPAPNF